MYLDLTPVLQRSEERFIHCFKCLHYCIFQDFSLSQFLTDSPLKKSSIDPSLVSECSRDSIRLDVSFLHEFDKVADRIVLFLHS